MIIYVSLIDFTAARENQNDNNKYWVSLGY